MVIGVACNDDADADNRVEGAVLGERGGGKWQFSCTWDALNWRCRTRSFNRSASMMDE